MAAIDLERGLEHSGRAWGKERPELMDNFDSEMQEWEEQLQDIQQKIEELYNGVQARRGANDVAPDSQKNGGQLECGHGKKHPGAASAPHLYSNGCHYSPGGYGYPVTRQNGFGCCNADSEIGDLLQDYLGQGQETSRRSDGARHVRFSDTIKVSPATEIRKSSGNERLGQEQLPVTFEQTENRKNQVSHMKSSPNKENTGAKPPLGQRDPPAVQPRSQPPATATPESPAPDRKAFGPGALGDRKCASPSVLRKFGAMLQENEGKTLNESGVVTHQGPVPEPKCLTPACQRRALGAAAAAGKAPLRAPVQKCRADSDAPTAETEPGQEWGLAPDSARRNHKDHRGAYAGAKGAQRGGQPAQRRSQSSPKIRPRANSGADRDGGERARKPASQHVEPRMDTRVLSASAGAQKNHRGGGAGQEAAGCGRVRDEGLIELLDMLEIQHEYSASPRAGHTAYRQDPRQVNPAQPPPDNLNRSFSRPARPANQRPPSRWAARTPTAIITSPSGPLYCPTSPLTRPRSPLTRPPSPALRHRPLVSYSLQTETVIM